jgi:hypothetical protein
MPVMADHTGINVATQVEGKILLRGIWRPYENATPKCALVNATTTMTLSKIFPST